MRWIIPGTFSLFTGVGAAVLMTVLCLDVRNHFRFKGAMEGKISMLKQLELKRGAMHKGGASVRVIVRYCYEVDGVEYESDRVSIHRSRDDFDRFNRKKYQELKTLEGGPVFYLERQPNLAVLDRTLRIPTLVVFGIGFILLSLFSVLFGRAALWEKRVVTEAG